ncbi:MAG TPA: hypothetical protein VHF06_22350 [Pseudonocardiaceae bacterium]|nr:hypothetical protein [Pseudonocardiaceae bacterium]
MADMRIDVTRLPDDVVALIEVLGPGDDLIVERDGTPVATISGTRDVLDDVTGSQPPDDGFDDVTVVATAMKLSAAARAALSAELGAEYIVLDMASAPRTADVLLVPPVSPQLIGNLRSMFPKARVVVTEIDDPELGVRYQGPVGRMLDAGAETYLTSTTIPLLALQLDRAVTQLTTGTTAAAPAIEAADAQDEPDS